MTLTEKAKLFEPLADAIVYEVGYQHYYNMNAVRLIRMLAACTKPNFIRDISQRIVGSRGADLALHEIGRRQIVNYLIRRLVPGRLALPPGYVLGPSRAAR